LPRILTTVSASRAKLLAAARTTARPVVGLVGSAIPVELVLAAGCHPLYLAADDADFSRDSAPMESFHEPEVRSLFRQAVTGGFEPCRLLVIASSSDGYRFLFQYLTEMQRTGRGARIPQLLLYDFQFGDTPSVDRYNRKVVQTLLAALAANGGTHADATAMCATLDRCNALRRSLALLQRTRICGTVAGSDALRHVAALNWAQPEASARELDEALAGLTIAASQAGPRLLLAGSEPCYHEHLHQLLESCGAQVILENDEWGTRRAGPQCDAGADPEAAICAHYKAHVCSPRQPTARREAWLRSQLESGAPDALLLYAPPSDQYFGWECPSLVQLAAAIGLPAMLLRSEVLDVVQAAEARAQVSAWLATVTPRAGATCHASPVESAR
jgi:benzoyl-CoA reductase/2-hydroxyglutaryl-CoA dehydratase subunit BcrC/BadD/HgdB